jgi:peptidoglycan/xylan/chitin deacetylase (PgdA/CDA1 family)
MPRRRRRLRLLAPLALLVGVVVAAVLVLGDDTAKETRPKPTRGTAQAPAAKPRPRPRIVRGPHRDPVPILMYHVVSERQPGAPYPDLYTPARVFAAQMRALEGKGYHGVTLAQVDDYWTRGYALPRKPIVVSFDDGYLSHYTHARAVLKAVAWPGVLNLEVNNVRPGDLTARQVRALIADGWEVDSHTITHPDLTTLTDSELKRELVGSRAYLRRRFGVRADYFCYPAGQFDARVVAAVKAAGYRAATTTQPGLATPDSRFTLNRIRIDGQDGVDGLLTKLADPGVAQNGSSAG